MLKNTLVLGVVLLLIGCSSDNDDITSLDPIIGTWYCEEAALAVQPLEDGSNVEITFSQTLSFNSDGTIDGCTFINTDIQEVILIWTSLGVPAECNIGELGTWENLNQEYENGSQTYNFTFGEESERQIVNFNSSFTEYTFVEDGNTITFVKQ